MQLQQPIAGTKQQQEAVAEPNTIANSTAPVLFWGPGESSWLTFHAVKAAALVASRVGTSASLLPRQLFLGAAALIV